jgi:hypothetical protein
VRWNAISSVSCPAKTAWRAASSTKQNKADDLRKCYVDHASARRRGKDGAGAAGVRDESRPREEPATANTIHSEDNGVPHLTTSAPAALNPKAHIPSQRVGSPAFENVAHVMRRRSRISRELDSLCEPHKCDSMVMASSVREEMVRGLMRSINCASDLEMFSSVIAEMMAHNSGEVDYYGDYTGLHLGVPERERAGRALREVAG